MFELKHSLSGICHILDDDTHDHRVTVALILQDNSYHLLHTSDEGYYCQYLNHLCECPFSFSVTANFTVELPRCLQHMGISKSDHSM